MGAKRSSQDVAWVMGKVLGRDSMARLANDHPGKGQIKHMHVCAGVRLN